MAPLFALTLFLSAALLFLVQPLIGRAVLPLLGGTPAVWNTCMLFFQMALLASYAYAHFTHWRLGTRGQALVQLVLLAVAALVLPVHVPEDWIPPAEETPVFWLLGLLIISVGLPFFAVAASAPLLQTWFTRTGHISAHDPYFLYSAGNLGSVLGLVCYPLIVERWLTLADQAAWWAAGYLLLAGLTGLCAAASLQQRKLPIAFEISENLAPSGTFTPWRWIALAFIPSSLLLGVTTYLTTDVAAMPLLWVAPLTIYLLTFALAFARRPPIPHRWMIRVLPIVVIAVTLAMLSQATEPLWLLVIGHLLLLFVVGMVCHGELARSRPRAERLTAYYFCLALGGALGGVFNGLIAPLVFWGIVEYPLVLVLASLMAPPRSGDAVRPARGDVLWPLGLGVLTAGLIFVAQSLGLSMGMLALAATFAVPAVLCYAMVDRPLRFGLGVAALLIAGTFHQGIHGRTIFQERSFFGVHRVVLNHEGTAHVLIHGNTVHGMQWLDPARNREALVYYHERGPIGVVFAHLERRGARAPVAVIGLGAGSLATYGQPGQEFTFFEIDPVVIRIAGDPALFTFLRDSPATINIVAGDARLTLAKSQPGHYGLIVIDAFSSDAIPTHLLTREALAIYRAKLAEGGVIAFHLSNRHVDLPPIVGDLAGDCGMACVSRDDLTQTSLDEKQGKSPSQWVLLAQRREDLPASSFWLPLAPRPGRPIWTDDYCNLAGEMRLWKE